ncbi:MAG: ATP-dependent DNA helicase RecG [Acidimicrobiales bacterium]
MSDLPPRPLGRLRDVELTRLRRVGQRRGAELAELGLRSVLDLVEYYPRTYVDRSRRAALDEVVVGDHVTVMGEVQRVSARRTRQGRSLVQVVIGDGSATLTISYFNQPWRERQLAAGAQVLAFGTVDDYRGTRQMTNPATDVLAGSGDAEATAPRRVGRLVPVYATSEKLSLSSWEIGALVEEALRRAGPVLDPWPADVISSLGLLDRSAALWAIHVPRDQADHQAARERLAFDELLRLQLALALRRRQVELFGHGVAHRVASSASRLEGDDGLVGRLVARQPFALTGAQQRVLREILDDLAAPVPMHRLLQGDVGSGKTLIATAALAAVVDDGFQGALMVPTEILAEQHLASLQRDLGDLTRHDASALGGQRGVEIRLLSGRLGAAARRATLAGLATGQIDLVVGTHALLSESVQFHRLGMVVIDEQHRFGVDQRAVLRDKAWGSQHGTVDPDLLVLTATPIPRTAALALFGDLDRSVIDELPAGRVAIETTWAATPGAAAAAWQRVRSEVAAGRRAYVVCPLVEEGGKVEATGAVAEFARLAESELAGLDIGLVHGQMPAAQRDAVMEDFRAGRLGVLVATVVVEVGVDVPDATVIVIEDAWRFGLAQLHQLRGRVGRSTWPSWCYLLGAAPSDDGERRLEALVATTDGFALAEVDLELRGEGAVLGSRQRGRSDLRLASLVRDAALVERAHRVARDLVATGRADDPVVRDELELLGEDVSYLFKS